MNRLYVFVDVSGNYDFSATGTKYIVLTSVMSTDICPGVLELYKLKHDMIDQGVDIEYFHAAEDKQTVRDGVLKIIAGLTNLRIDSIVVEKRKTAPKIRPLKIFYPKMIEYLLKYPFDPQRIDVSGFDKVFIFMDREGSRASERDAVIKAIKMSLARHLGKVPYVICMHSSVSHYYLQIVDYCSWAIYVKHERGEHRPYSKVQGLVSSEFRIFEDGNIDWY
ncbi:MAG: DUF3800 domain-containing protein [Dehalococcoidales bacterium]